MRKSSVRGMLFSVIKKRSGSKAKKKPPSLAVYLDVAGFSSLHREPAATPPPWGWNG
jgi:hypothetical protein